MLSVACGKNQEPLLNAAKQLGYSIIGVDQSPDTELVDLPVRMSTHATDEVLYELKNGGYPKFDAVLCRSSGPAVVTAAVIAEAYSLPTTGNLVAKCSVSKTLLHHYLTKRDICTVPTLLAKPGELKPDRWQQVVIKPSQPQFGKKNVYLISEQAEYMSAIQAAVCESLDGCALAQKYIEGSDVGLVTLSRSGEIIWYAFFQELNDWDGTVIDPLGVSSLKVPLSQRQHDGAILSAKKVIADSGSTGFVLFSFRVFDTADPMLYEINSGLCGDQIAESLLPGMWPGFDFFQMDVLTMTNHEPPLPNAKCKAATYTNL